MKNIKKGFTIVELVIVIAVIAILAGVLIPTFSGVVGKANESARNQEMTNALKVTLAGNAATGALAEGTVFVIESGNKLYVSEYNGNKLGTIEELDSVFSAQTYNTVIINTSYSESGNNTLKNIATLYGAESAAYVAKSGDVAEHILLSGGTNDAKKLSIFWNVDFSKGTVVLYPAN